jgi:hypothetical protein
MPSGPASTLHDHAARELRFIRDTMARAGGFTAVPGRGGIAMGVTALVTAAATARVDDEHRWLAAWLADAALATTIGAVAMAMKARTAGIPLTAPAARRFALAFVPALVAAVVLTAVLVARGLVAALPGTWLLLYGVAVMSGGSTSVRPVPVFGAMLMAFGCVALAVPPGWGTLLMAAGFGLGHIVTGYVIARWYGG